MALIHCRECGQRISSKAKQCPYCGIELKSKSGCGCSTILIIGLAILGLLFALGSLDFGSTSSKKSKSPPSFILTEMNGRELEETATFTVRYDKTFKLELADGTTYIYTAVSHVGEDELCNIVANDNFGRKTAICMKKLDGDNILIMLENDEMISNFKGYLER